MTIEKNGNLPLPEHWQTVLNDNTQEALEGGMLSRYYQALSERTGGFWVAKYAGGVIPYMDFDEEEARQQMLAQHRAANNAATVNLPIGFRTREVSGTEIEAIKVNPATGQAVTCSDVPIGVLDIFDDTPTPLGAFTPDDVALARRRLAEQDAAGVEWSPAPLIIF